MTTSAPLLLRDLIHALDALAPAGSAEGWDNVGLQVGDPAMPITKALVALDCTVPVLEEARALGAEVIVTHHPLIFEPLRSLQPGGGPAGLAYALARAGVALVAAHTNLDVARAGVSFALADRLGVRDCAFLRPSPERRAVLVTFVPPDHADAVRHALADAGAGRIGAYAECSFGTAGEGTFRPDASANPFTGTPAGTLERAAEVRLEMECARYDAGRVVAALHAAHPYEQPAYHLLDARQADASTGLGAIGRLAEPMPAEAFLRHLCTRLGTPAVRATRFDGAVRTVAVCGGSGSAFVADALRAGADAYVTADVTYHKFFDVLDPEGRARLLYADVGHYESERHAEQLLADGLRARLPALDVRRTAQRTAAADVFVS